MFYTILCPPNARHSAEYIKPSCGLVNQLIMESMTYEKKFVFYRKVSETARYFQNTINGPILGKYNDIKGKEKKKRNLHLMN